MIGGWIGILAALGGAVLLFSGGHVWLGALAVGVALLAFWSFGVMHNYAHTHNAEWVRNFRANSRDAGMSENEVENIISQQRMAPNLDAIPDRLAFMNMLSSVAALILLVIGIVLLVL